MGSSVKGHLRPRCGVFHQIPTLAVATGGGPRGKAAACAPSRSCLLAFSPTPVYLRCTAAASCGNVCSLAVFACRPRICDAFLQPPPPTHRHLIWGYLSHLLLLAWRGPHVRALAFGCVHVLAPCDSWCACDPGRTCDRCSEGWLVDTKSWQGSFLLPRL